MKWEVLHYILTRNFDKSKVHEHHIKFNTLTVLKYLDRILHLGLDPW